MSSNFLQRFKGKTQTLSKEGVHQILGSKGVESGQGLVAARETYNSVNKGKNSSGQNFSNKVLQDNKNKTVKPVSQPQVSKPTKSENPFLVSNPFYFDEQEREREEIQRREKVKIEESTRKAEQALQAQKDPKQNTKTSNYSTYSRSVDKKSGTGKEWTKLGGLGANVGGDDWVQKKKKLQKMQEFAGQVKNINSEKNKLSKPDIPKPSNSKESTSRQKALEYSKNVPKPTVKKVPEIDEVEEEEQVINHEYEGLTELQIYQMKHQQLKRMVRNNQ